MSCRLLLLHSVFEWWGVPARYIQLADRLDRHRFEVTRLGVPDVVDKGAMPASTLEIMPWVERSFRQLRMPWHNMNDLDAEARAVMECRAGKVDIVHFLDGEHAGGHFATWLRNAGASTGAKAVASFHQPPSLAEQVLNGPALRDLDALVLMSPSQLPYFRQFVSGEKLHIFLHGVDTDFFRPAEAERRSDRLLCITTGLHLRDWKALMAVAAAMPEVDFTVVTSSKLKLEPIGNVKVLTGLTDAALAEAYRGADVLFLPLIDATANNSLLEGIASGLPVVSTNLESVRAYLPGDQGFLIDDNNVDGIVDAIGRLKDHALRREMGSRARERAEQLSWSRMIRQYELLYGHLSGAREDRSLSAPTAVAETTLPEGGPITLGREAERTGEQPGSPASLAGVATWGANLAEIGLVAETRLLLTGLAGAFPTNPETLRGLAHLSELEWRWSDAIGYWDEYLRDGDAQLLPDVALRSALCLARIGRPEEAGERLHLFLKGYDLLEGEARIAEICKSSAAAMNAWERCTLQHPDRIEGFIGYANALLRHADYEKADNLLQHVTSVWRRSAEAAILWADAATLAGRLGEAGKRWRSCQSRFPGMGAAGLGRYFGSLCDTPEALAYLASLPDGSTARAVFLLGKWTMRHKLAPAIEQAHLLVREEPHRLWRRVQVSLLLIEMGTEASLAEASGILGALRQRSPHSVAVKTAEVALLLRKSDHERAVSLLGTMVPSVETEALAAVRRWASSHINGNHDAAQLWKILFLDFGLLFEEGRFSCPDARLVGS